MSLFLEGVGIVDVGGEDCPRVGLHLHEVSRDLIVSVIDRPLAVHTHDIALGVDRNGVIGREVHRSLELTQQTVRHDAILLDTVRQEGITGRFALLFSQDRVGWLCRTVETVPQSRYCLY